MEHRAFPEPLTVVGLVKDAQYNSLKQAAPRIIYLSGLQGLAAGFGVNIAVRTAENPEKMADLLWKEARGESPHLRLEGVTT